MDWSYDLMAVYKYVYYYYYYFFFDPGTQFPRKEKITLCNIKKYKKLLLLLLLLFLIFFSPPCQEGGFYCPDSASSLYYKGSASLNGTIKLSVCA